MYPKPATGAADAKTFTGNSRVRAIALGQVSGLIAFDVDCEAGELLLVKLAGSNLPNTLEYATVHRYRLFYLCPEVSRSVDHHRLLSQNPSTAATKFPTRRPKRAVFAVLLPTFWMPSSWVRDPVHFSTRYFRNAFLLTLAGEDERIEKDSTQP
jgi:hypothetical protein